MFNKTYVIIQARMGSSRLPGKIMLPLAGRPVLEHVVSRLMKVFPKQRIIVATSNLRQDDEVVALSASLGVTSFRGSETDVLSRFYDAAKSVKADYLVRCNSDCPLICPQVVRRVICTFFKYRGAYDYVSNILSPSYPVGMHCEIFKFQALERSFFLAREQEEREHVTPFIYRNPDIFNILNVLSDDNNSKIRLTLDHPEDYKLISLIYDHLYASGECFNLEEILVFLNENPELALLNSHLFSPTRV